MKTLVIHFGGIGDFILSCPALYLLAQDGPVDLLGYRSRLELAVAGGLALRAFDAAAVDFDSVFSGPSSRLRAFLRDYDRCLLFMRDTGEVIEAIAACGIGHTAAFPGLPPEDYAAHASHYYLDAVAQFLGAATPPRKPAELKIPPATTSRGIVIHPGSGGKQKNWPLANFEEISLRLAGLGAEPAWVLGPAESDLQAPPGIEVLRTESLMQLAQELAAADHYIGNDSGITHLAAAVGCPTTAIFGPTNPQVWVPLGEHVVVVQGNPWPTVDEVMARVF